MKFLASPSQTVHWSTGLRGLALISGLMLLATVLPGAGAAPEIAIEQPTGTPLVNGRTFAWGYNSDGQTNVPGAAQSGVKAVAAGWYHSVALKDDGTLVAWGLNSAGQSSVPTGLSGVKAVAAGWGHTVALKSNGTVIAWGWNTSGQTNVPDGLTDVQAIAAGYSHTVALKSNGTVVAWGYNFSGQTNVPAGLTGVQAIAAGHSHTVALKDDGTVVAWGANDYGQATVPLGLLTVQAISAGSAHTAVLQTDGTVAAWGYNAFGQTTVPSWLTAAHAIAAGGTHTLALLSNSTAVAWGSSNYGQANVPVGMAGVRSVAAGYVHTVVLADSSVGFGKQFLGRASATKTFTIKNTGDAMLNITNVSVIGGDVSDFTVSTNGMLTPLPATTGITTFTVTFTPSALGTRTTTLRVIDDDSDENPFDIVLIGTGVIAPEIAVFTGDSTNIADERFDNTGTNIFGVTVAGGATSQIFTIKNTGITNLTGLALTKIGSNPGDFSLSALATTNLAPAETTTFTVTFSPISVGLRRAVVAIASNDEDETSFEINVSGMGLVPEIAIEQPTGKPLGSVVTWGDNSYGQTNVPVGLAGVQAVVAGELHTVALKSDGTVVAWGYNVGGQTNIPVGLTGVVAIAAGGYHTVGLKNDGTVVAWGGNDYGQTNVPVGLTGVVAIAAGGYHTVALKSNGTIVAWGYNSYGQTTMPGGLTGVQAIAAGGYHTVALKSNGTIVAWGGNDYGQTNVPVGLTGVVAIAAGGYHTVALKSNGTIVAWGNNFSRQTNVPVGLTGVQAIAAGGAHTVALANSTVIFGKQQIATTSAAKTFTVKNTGNGALNISSVSVIGGHASDFTVSTNGMLTSVPAPTGVTTFTVTFTPSALGDRKTTLRVLSNDGDEGNFNIEVTGMGAIIPEIVVFNGTSTNAVDERTDNSGTNAFATTVVGSSTTQTFTIKNTGYLDLTGLALAKTGTNTSDFTLSALSTNTLAPDETTTFTVTFSPTAGGTRRAVVAIASDDEDENPFEINVSGVALAPEISIEQPAGTPLGTGIVVAWGKNAAGQTNVPSGLAGVQAVAAGGYHTLAIKTDGTIVAWGNNVYGETSVPVGLTDVQAIAAGAYHTVALKSNGTVVAWGRNDFSQTNVPDGLAGVQAIAAGYHHTVALKNDGTVIAWGYNPGGQMNAPAGLTDVQAVAAGWYFGVALKNDGTVVAWGSNSAGQTNVPVGLTGVQAIAAGGNQTVALKNDGTVVAWGDNSFGQTTVPNGLAGVRAIAAGWFHTVALQSNGTVVAWGSNSSGQTSMPGGLTGVQAIAASGEHTVVLRDSVVGFGNQLVAITSPAKTFTIKNTGSSTLNIANVSVTGGNASDFTVNTDGMLSSVAAGNQTTFTVTYTPGALGDRRTTLRVLNNDTDEGVFDIVLTGGVALQPEIAVFTGTSTNAVDERTDNTGTNVFATTVVGSSTVQTFTIKNTGPGNLAALALFAWGANPGAFTLGALGINTLTPDSTTTFTVAFSPTAVGVRSAVISISSNDGNENPFRINVSGTGLALPSPVINAQNLTVAGNGGFQFTFANPDNLTFSVLASTNLGLPAADWTVVGTATNIGGGLYQFAHPVSPDFPQRFYRLRFP